MPRSWSRYCNFLLRPSQENICMACTCIRQYCACVIPGLPRDDSCHHLGSRSLLFCTRNLADSCCRYTLGAPRVLNQSVSFFFEFMMIIRHVSDFCWPLDTHRSRQKAADGTKGAKMMQSCTVMHSRFRRPRVWGDWGPANVGGAGGGHRACRVRLLDCSPPQGQAQTEAPFLK